MQSYDPSQVKLMFGGREWYGCNDYTEVEKPWYRVLSPSEVGKIPHVEGATRIDMCVANNVWTTVNLYNTSPSLGYILSLDPYDWSQNRQMKINGETVTSGNAYELGVKHGKQQ